LGSAISSNKRESRLEARSPPDPTEESVFMARCWTAFLIFGLAPAPTLATLQVTAMSPVPGTTLGVAPTLITLTLNAPPDPASVNTVSVLLTRAGADHLLGTADDVVVLPNSIALVGNQIQMDFTGLTLPNDQYRLTVRGTDLPISNLVHWWRLDDGSGTTAVDSAGAANGTLGGGGGTLPTWSAGRLGGGLLFAGTDNRVLMGAADLPAPWTAAMWVNRTASGAGDARLMDSAANSLRLEQFNSPQEVGVTMYSSVDTPFSYTAPTGQWVHLTFVGESSGTSLFVNGVFVQKVGTSLSCPLNSLGSTSFNSMAGTLDDVRIFGRVLSPNEIIAVAGLGGSVRDTSGNALDGEFTGTFPSGNGTRGGDFVADFTLSTSPARVTGMTPLPGTSVATAPSVITIATDSPLDPATVSSATALVTRAGPDGILGTADDVLISPTVVSVSGGNTIRIALPGGLPADLYQVTVSGTIPPLPAPTNSWSLDEAQGTTAVDSAGGLTGTLGGGGGTLPSWTNGRLGTGLFFNGSDNRVFLGGVDLAVPWTTTLWVYRLNSVHEDARLTDSNSYSLRLEQYNYTKEVGVSIYGSTDATFSYTAPIGQWVHLSFVGDSLGTSLYVNGVFSQKIGTVIASPRNAMGSGGYNSMVGILDEIQNYDSALTSSQIQRLAALGGAVRNTSSVLLDGEFSGTFPSGNGIAGGDFVATFTVLSGPPSPPAPPTGLVAQAGDSLVALSWVGSIGASSYTVRRSLASGGPYTVIASGLTSPSYLDTGLSNQTTYFYEVTAVNGAGESGESNKASATPSAPPPQGSVQELTNITVGGCGATGAEILIPIALLWGFRSTRRGRPTRKWIFLLVIFTLEEAPSLPAQEPERPGPSPENSKLEPRSTREPPPGGGEPHGLPTRLAENDMEKNVFLVQARGGAWLNPSFDATTDLGLRQIKSGAIPEAGLDVGYRSGHWIIEASIDYGAAHDVEIWAGGVRGGLVQPVPLEDLTSVPIFLGLSMGVIGGHLQVSIPGFGNFKSAWGFQARAEIMAGVLPSGFLTLWADFRSLAFEFEGNVLSGDTKAMGATLALGGGLLVQF
jgi:hypothetical protein